MDVLYELYQSYLYLAIYAVAALLSYRRQKNEDSVGERSVLIFCTLFLGMAVSLLISWIPANGYMEWVKILVGGIFALGTGWFSILLLKRMLRICAYLVSLESMKSVGYGIPFFIIWMIQLFSNLPEEIVEWVECWYATDYSMGIGSRFFVGSVLSLFYDGYLDRKMAWVFCVAALILLLLLASFMLGKLISKAKNKLATIFLSACFVASPGSLAGYWADGNMGRLEMYTLLVTLLAVCLTVSAKRAWVKYSILAIAVCICNAIYQGYVFLYFPIIFIVIVCECFQKKFQRRDLIGGSVVVLCACATFLLFQFGTSVEFDTAEQMMLAIRERSNVAISEDAISLEMFSSLPEAYSRTVIPYLTEGKFPREAMLVTIFATLPLLLMAFALYLKCFRNSKKSVFVTPYFYVLLSQLEVVPQFLLNIDWGRWLISMNIVFFFGVFYLLYRGFDEMEEAVMCLDRFIKKNYMISVFTLLYLSALPKFSVYGMRVEIVEAIKNFSTLLGIR